MVHGLGPGGIYVGVRGRQWAKKEQMTEEREIRRGGRGGRLKCGNQGVVMEARGRVGGLKGKNVHNGEVYVDVI